MHGSPEMAAGLLPSVISAAAQLPAGVETVVCPPMVLVSQVKPLAAGSRVAVGAQNCHHEVEGAFTGNTSAVMLKDAGCGYVIVGHSERRMYHGENNEAVAKKAAAAMAAGLMPIVCIGETLAERQAGREKAVVKEQVLKSVPKGADTGHFLLAYEPVWAIGSGQTPTLEDIRAMHAHIRSVAGKVAVLYGGSVKASNAKEILALDGVSGVLVGGASLKADEFCAIMKSA